MLLLSHATLFVVLFGKNADYSLFKVFGCLAYASTLSMLRFKFDLKARPCIFVGYPPGCWEKPPTSTVGISRKIKEKLK